MQNLRAAGSHIRSAPPHWALLAFILIGSGAAVAEGAESRCYGTRYVIRELPLRPNAINAADEVAGTTEEHRAAVWSARAGLRELPLPDGFANSEGIGINRHGNVVGNAYDHGFGNHEAFLFRRGVLTVLPGSQTRAYAINDGDVVAGSAIMAPGKSASPVSWHGTAIRDIAGCCGGSATGINNAGALIGNVYDDDGTYHAFLWRSSDGSQSVGPPHKSSTAVAVNARGDAIVQAFTAVFLYSDSQLIPLALHPRFPSKPLAINDCDVVVGAYGPFSDADRAFIWHASLGFRDLNSMIPGDSGWTLQSATAINARGAIVGKGKVRGQDDVGFMLLPQK